MIVSVPMEVDERTAEILDAVLVRHGASCWDAVAIEEFLRAVSVESFARAAARDLLAERYRDFVDQFNTSS